MDDEKIGSLGQEEKHKLQYVVPDRLILHLEPLGEEKDSVNYLRTLWLSQSLLVLSHIFEVFDHLEVTLIEGNDIEIDGRKLKKPVLEIFREKNRENAVSPSYEVVTDPTYMICEHFYKYYIFTHQVEPKSQRVARPVVSRVPTNENTNSEPQESTWVVQPKNSNALVRGLRLKRHAATAMSNYVDNMFRETSIQIAEMIVSAGKSETKSNIIWLPSDVVVLTRKLRLSPFTSGVHPSILDFVDLVHIRAYLEALETNQKIKGLSSSLSVILEWVDRIQSIPEWKRAISKEEGFLKVEALAQFEIKGNFEISLALPEGVTLADYIKNQEKVKAPRCDWVTDKKRNHHLVKTPYETLLLKLEAANIEVPDDTKKGNEETKKIVSGGKEIEVRVGEEESIGENLLPWKLLPAQLDPSTGSLNAERALRKRQQISNIVHYVSRLVEDDFEIIDFCGGGGHISLVLAWVFPNTRVTLIDRNEVSLAFAEKRKKELGITNLDIICSDVQQWKAKKFDVGVAIHACGSLTDIILDKCIDMNAAYVLAPCCFGSLQNADTAFIELPRSQLFHNAGVTLQDYMSLSSVADINTSGVSLESKQYLTGKKAMSIIDHDRNQRAAQNGYQTFQFTMKPPTCTPKNEIICGFPKSSNKGQEQTDFFYKPIDNSITVRKPQ